VILVDGKSQMEPSTLHAPCALISGSSIKRARARTMHFAQALLLPR